MFLAKKLIYSAYPFQPTYNLMRLQDFQFIVGRSMRLNFNKTYIHFYQGATPNSKLTQLLSQLLKL
jgi:hypothetical protein